MTTDGEPQPGDKRLMPIMRRLDSAEQAITFLKSAGLRELRAALETTLRDVRPEVLVEIEILHHLALEGRHCATPLLLCAVAARVPVWIYGDSGSGKSTAAELVARELSLPFSAISVCPTTTKSDVLGYMDAGGTYRTTEFRKRFEGGGVFLIDEIDKANAQVIAVLNSALSNDLCAFPDGMIRRHEDCVIIAAANTIGRGANVRFVGRAPVDATTLDRFIFLHMDIDENLENALAGLAFDQNKLVNVGEGGHVGTEGWVDYVRQVRHAVANLGIDQIISPRATLYGLRLLKMGVGATHVKEMCVWKGMREADRERVVAAMRVRT